MTGRRRAVLAAVLLFVLAGATAGVVRAEGGAPVAPAPAPAPAPGPGPVPAPGLPPAPGGAPDGRAGDATAEPVPPSLADSLALAEKLMSTPELRVARWALTIVPIGLGVLVMLLLLYRAYGRYDERRRLGMPPPLRAGPTVAFEVVPALALALGSYLVLGTLGELLARGLPDSWALAARLLTTLVALGVPAAFTLWRRHARGAPALRPLRVAGRGFVTYAVGVATAAGLMAISVAIYVFFGREVSVYGVVQEALAPEHPSYLYWIGAFAVLVAPVTEEAVFRGLLFPAFRHAAGGGRRGYWIGAVVSSLLFAGIHAHGPSLLPLFGLAMVFATVVEHTDSLATTMVAHALFNASNIVPMIIARVQGVL